MNLIQLKIMEIIFVSLIKFINILFRTPPYQVGFFI